MLDEATLIYDSYRVSSGEVLYRDYFEFQGPVSFYLLGAVLAITGPSIMAARGLFIIITACSALLLARIVERFCGWRVAVAAAAIHATAMVPEFPSYYAHWVAELWVLGALFLLTRRERPNSCSDFAVGALLGTAGMTIQSLGVPVLVAVLGTVAGAGALIRDWRVVLWRPVLILGGASVAIAAWIGYFAAQGALNDLYYSMFEWPFTNYLQGQGDAVVFGWGISEDLDLRHQHVAWVPRMLNTFVLRVDLVLAYLLIPTSFAVLAAVATRWYRRRVGVGFAYGAAMAIAAMTPLFLGLARRDITHVAFLGGLTLAGLLCASSVCRVRWVQQAIAALAVCIAVLSTANYVYKAFDTAAASRAMGSWEDAVRNLAEAQFIDERTSPDARIVVASGPWYYLYIRPSASPLTLFFSYYTPKQIAWIGDRILREKPEVLMMDEAWWRTLLMFRPELAGRYARQGDYLWALRPSFTRAGDL
jgi:hypothetical protein